MIKAMTLRVEDPITGALPSAYTFWSVYPLSAASDGNIVVRSLHRTGLGSVNPALKLLMQCGLCTALAV